MSVKSKCTRMYPHKTMILCKSCFCKIVSRKNVFAFNRHIFKTMDGQYKIIYCFHKLFCIHGLPHIIISNNEPSFVSSEFKECCPQNAIKVVGQSCGAILG